MGNISISKCNKYPYILGASASVHEQHRGQIPPRSRDRGRRGHHRHLPLPPAHRTATPHTRTSPVR